MSIDISRLGKAAQAQILKQLRENEKRRIEREQGSRIKDQGSGGRGKRISPQGRNDDGGNTSSGASRHLPLKGKAMGGENKLHAERTADGHDSKREAKRAAELRLMEKAGEISNLREQVEYDLLPAVYEREDGLGFRTDLNTKKEAEKAAGCKLKLVERGVSYVADFVYQKDGHTVVEDTKGYKNTSAAVYRVFVIKRKLLFGKYGIRVVEV